MMGALHEVLAYDDPYAGVCGLVYVMDFTTVHRDHLSGFTATLLKFLTSLKEKALPMRLRAIYFINLKPFVEQLLKIGLSVMPTSLKKKVSGELFSKNPQILTIFFFNFQVFVCGKDFSSLPESLPLKYLPREYGGENGNLDEIRDNCIKMWENYREFFQMNSSFRFEEKLFMGEPIYSDEVSFGAGGSFRKIEVD